MEKTREQTLEQLSRMTSDDIDKYRDEKLLEYKGVLAEYYTEKDNLLVRKHEKRQCLIQDGQSFSRIEQILRGDEQLFKMKRVVMGLQGLKKKLELEREILSSYYWKARNE